MSAAHTSKIRIYDLAKELKMESKRLIEEVRREGVDVSVPSNTISKELAEKIRNKYFPKKEPTVQRSIRVVKKAKPSPSDAEVDAAYAAEPAEAPVPEVYAAPPAPEAEAEVHDAPAEHAADGDSGGAVRPLTPRILRPRPTKSSRRPKTRPSTRTCRSRKRKRRPRPRHTSPHRRPHRRRQNPT